jgi:FkbM family methyltransferase
VTLRRSVLRAVRPFLHRAGIEVISYRPSVADRDRMQLLVDERIDLLLDVGASTGTYVERVRADGYRGRVISFEPLLGSFSELSRAASGDDAWECRRVALGDTDGPETINVSRNRGSSSVLPITERCVESAPEAEYVATEEIEVARLDSLAPTLVGGARRLFLKLDVQGFELHVLRGAAETLRLVRGLEAELSLAPLYEGQVLLQDMVDYLEHEGFALIGLARGFRDRSTGRILQLDGLFVRAVDAHDAV